MLLCGSCGTAVEPGQSYCEDCGEPVKKGEPPASPASSHVRANPQTQASAYQQQINSVRSKRNWIVPIVAALFAIALSSGLTAWLLHNRGVPTTNSVASRPQAIAIASSTRNPAGSLTYLPNNCIDGNLGTAWVEGVAGSGIGEWIRFDFDREVELLRVRLAPGYFKSSQSWLHNNRLAVATMFLSDGSSRIWYLDDRMEQQDLGLGGVKIRWVRMTIDKIYPGTVDSEDSPISEITFDLKP